MNAPDRWPFPAQENTTCPEAERILGGADHTPDELQLAIEAQGRLIEKLVDKGKYNPARQAFEVVRLLASKRTPETVAAMEQARGLR